MRNFASRYRDPDDVKSLLGDIAALSDAAAAEVRLHPIVRFHNEKRKCVFCIFCMFKRRLNDFVAEGYLADA